MKKLSARIITGILAICAVAIPAAASDALINGHSVIVNERAPKLSIPVDGGWWDYGIGLQHVYSNYDHPERERKASCQGQSKEPVSSDWVSPGIRAESTDWKALTNNRAWYDWK